MDVESLQKSGRRRGSCLDVFLVVSIIFLFVAVGALAVGEAMLLMGVRPKLDSKLPSFEYLNSQLTTPTPDPAYKMQNFAYLRAASSELKTSNMQWEQVYYGPRNSVGSNFEFDKNQHSLKPVRDGSYFMYIDLNLTCTSPECMPGMLSVRVNDKLTCEVEVPAETNSVSRKCWTVSWIEGQKKLFTQITVSAGDLKDWKLELSSSGFGMFLVDS